MNTQNSRKKIAVFVGLTAVISALAFAGDAKTPIEVLQEQVIALQKEKMELMSKISKMYKSAAICYSSKSDCIKEQQKLNNKYGLFSNGEISLTASCQTEQVVPGTVCEDSPYFLRTQVKIDPGL